MKVVFDNQVFHMQKFGGINRYFNEIMQINKSGIEVEFTQTFIDRPEVPLKTDLLSRGVRFLKRKIGVENKAQPQLENYINTFPGLNFDIFHPTYYDPYFLDLTSKPFVLTVYDMIHEIYAEYSGHRTPLSRNKRLLCEKASQVIVISETTKRDLIDIFKLPGEKVHAIPLASNFDEIEPQQPKNAENLENYILFVGLRAAYKNFYFSAIALSELLKNDKELLLVCTGHEFSEEELEFFKGLKIEKQVRHIYLQNDNELAWAYQNARMFIFPSLYEGFGLPLLEAFAKDCPVICSNTGSLGEVGGDAVLYFDPKSVLQLQDVAYKALYDNETRNDLVIRGRNRLKKFSWDKCRTETIEVYKSI